MPAHIIGWPSWYPINADAPYFPTVSLTSAVSPFTSTFVPKGRDKSASHWRIGVPLLALSWAWQAEQIERALSISLALADLILRYGRRDFVMQRSG
jgi:hypothetical protein